MKKLFLVMVILGILSTSVFAEKRYKVAFFSPASEGHMFFGLFENYMQKACDDLGMDLNIYYANDNASRTKTQVKELLESNDLPDAIVFMVTRGQGIYNLEIAEQKGVYSFIVNSSFLPEESPGKPRERYKYWIGEMVPDDEKAGYELAQTLIEQARENNKPLELLALGGSEHSTASMARIEGLKKSLAENPDVRLQRILPANWSGQEAKEKFQYFRRRNLKLSIVWTASDGMGLGVAESAKEIGLKTGRDVFTGGVDWSKAGLQAVKEGKMDATIGGHLFEGAWVSVLLYDYLNGKDFADEGLNFQSQMFAATKSNVDQVLNMLTAEGRQELDFKKFSKVYNEDLEEYNFSLNRLLDN